MGTNQASISEITLIIQIEHEIKIYVYSFLKLQYSRETKTIYTQCQSIIILLIQVIDLCYLFNEFIYRNQYMERP